MTKGIIELVNGVVVRYRYNSKKHKWILESGKTCIELTPKQFEALLHFLKTFKLAEESLTLNIYAEALAYAIAKYYRQFKNEILNNKWTWIPETPLSDIAEYINEYIGLDISYDEHVQYCKSLAESGFISFDYGGISVVKGKKNDDWWINVKDDYLYRKILKFLKQF